MIREELAKRLKHYRELSGMTVYEVGNFVGKSGKTISAWESGRGQPDADMLVSLCKLYQIKSISELFGEPSTSFTDEERELLEIFHKLNSDGQKKLLERAEELLSLGYDEKGARKKMA